MLVDRKFGTSHSSSCSGLQEKNRKFFLACRQKSQNWKIVAAAMPFIYIHVPGFPPNPSCVTKKGKFFMPLALFFFSRQLHRCSHSKEKKCPSQFSQKGKKVLENVYGKKGRNGSLRGLGRDSVNIGYCILRK